MKPIHTFQKTMVSVFCVIALITGAFATQAVGLADIGFHRSSNFVVLVDDDVAGNFNQQAEARSAAREAKLANPDSDVGYFDTDFYEAQLAESPPTATPVPPTPIPATLVPATLVPNTPVPATAIPATPVPATAVPTPATTVPPTPTALDDVPTRLVGIEDLAYQGSFTLPEVRGRSEDSFSNVGVGLAYNPARDSLFITGRYQHQTTAEISVPTPGIEADIANLPRAELLRSPEDATDGKLRDLSDPPDDIYGRVGGYLVTGNQLVVSGYDYYDASNKQIRSHLVTDIDLGASSEMLSIADDVRARWLGGPMAHIPEQWQSAFGGDPWLTGLGGVSIASNSSLGPTAATFSPASLRGEDPARLVLGYPLAEPLDVPTVQSDLWNRTSSPRGVVFPTDTASVLFFGDHGTGPYCYGTGADCGDPVNPYKGSHAYPYRAQLWAYNAADLVAVHNGERTPQSLRPYEVAGIDLPYSTEYPTILGAAYDESGGRIFLTQAKLDNTLPVIHVYTVSPASTSAPGPTPTSTPIPTATPVAPTPTPIPTATPATPTATPAAPTATPTPAISSNPCPAYVDSEVYRARANRTLVTPDQDWERVLTSVEPDTEILFADGEYRFTRDGVWMEQANLTIRSASGDRDAVVLIGKGNSERGEGLMIAGPDVTIADITVTKTRNHGITLKPARGGTGTHVYNVNLVDIGTQFIKSSSGADNPNGIVACSSMGYSSLDAVEGDYFAAIDLHQAIDWVLRDNYIYNMAGDGSGCEVDIDCGRYFSHPAILVWNNSSGTVIERNTMIDNTRSITLGLGSGHTGGVVRNNFIYQSNPGDAGIELWNAPGVLVEHNTVLTNDYRGAIEYGGSADITLRNNLLSHPPLDRSGSRGPSPRTVIEGNITNATDADLVAPGNPHLPPASRAIGAGVTPADVDMDDIDNQPRNRRWDVGADHFTG